MRNHAVADGVPSPARLNKLSVRIAQFAVDVSVLVGAFWLSYELRFDFGMPDEQVRNALHQLPYVLLIQVTALLIGGVYSFVWRYIGLAEVRAFLGAAASSCLAIILLRVGLPKDLSRWQVPLSVCLMDTIFSLGAVLSVRILRRVLHERSRRNRRVLGRQIEQKRRVLLIGAGRAGVFACREIQNNVDMNIVIAGFVDDDPNKLGSVISGVKVLGTTDGMPRLIKELGVDHVILTIAGASRRDFRRILDICESVPIKVRVIPGLHDILEGKVNVTRIRDLQIEDMLGREPVQLEEENIARFLADKVVMVTGAGGSIGSELARQVIRFQPSSLILIERAEFALFHVHRELAAKWPAARIVPMVADVGDEGRMRPILSSYVPRVIFHSAAHKHVPMMETNPIEAVKNNILATRTLGELAGEFGVQVFVQMSTDKAVRPTSIMGATKRVAEFVVHDLNRKFLTRYVTVRFGNVIGSTGSVIPIFREQIRSGGPVTVTHPEMRRYFMTIPEAAQLVLQAAAMGEGGEIFILDMGEQVRILDLAKSAITLSGLKPFEEIEIVFTGIRPGEKLSEELEMGEENMSKTRHPKIFVGKIANTTAEAMRKSLISLEEVVARGDEREIRSLLSRLVPEARLDGSCDALDRGMQTRLARTAFGLAIVESR
jgi:FlaA1/EpsC-like NDP-sugar epimerase